MSKRELDEDDVRIRPGARSRPRSRLRPKHEDSVDALVTSVDRGRFNCLAGDVTITAMRAGEMRRTPVVVGDVVHLVGDVTGKPGSLARIVRVAPRTTLLRRTADDTDPIERPIVANADQLVIVVALAAPPPRPRLVDRCLVAALDAGLDPLLCVTKRDLGDPSSLLDAYAPLGVDAVTTSTVTEGDPGVVALRERLAGRTSVLVGHSGVGKSTLVNLLVPGAARRTNVLSGAGKGQHTSVNVEALKLGDGGWIIDTPGIRSFGLGHVTAESLLRAFPDLAPGAAACMPHCDHGEATAPTCGVAERVRDGYAEPVRLESYRRLLNARSGEDDQNSGDGRS